MVGHIIIWDVYPMAPCTLLVERVQTVLTAVQQHAAVLIATEQVVEIELSIAPQAGSFEIVRRDRDQRFVPQAMNQLTPHRPRIQR